MTSLAISDISTALKEKYPSGLPEDQMYETSPFMAAVRKDRESLASRSVHVPLKYARPQGASATFATGRTNMVGSKWKGFDVTPTNYYGFAQVDGDVAARAKAKNDGSFVDAVDEEIQGGIYTLGRQACRLFWGSGSGSLGQINATSNVSTDTITLANPSDIRFFEVGMVLKADDVDGGGTVAAGSVTVESLNRDTGTITVTAATWDDAAGIPTVAVSWYLFREGDYDAVIKGYEAWIPRTAPTSTLFFGVDRTPDSRLYGQRTDFSSYGIEEGLKRAVERLIREGSECDFGVLSSVDYLNMELAMGTRCVPTTVKAYKSDMVFDAVSVGLAGKKITIMMDPDAPVGRFMAGQLDTWTLGSLGPSLVNFNDTDGNQILRTTTTDAIEVQLVIRWGLWCNAPGKNGNFAIGS